MNQTIEAPTSNKRYRGNARRIRRAIVAATISLAIGAAAVLAGGAVADNSADEQAGHNLIIHVDDTPWL